MKQIRACCFYLIITLLAFFLVGCGDNVVISPTVPSNQTQTGTGQSTQGKPDITGNPLNLMTLKPTADTASLSGTLQLIREKFNQLENSNYRYKINQNATVYAGTTRITTSTKGEGIKASSKLSQKIELNTDGQPLTVENLVIEDVNWQRISTLEIWQNTGRKINPDRLFPVDILSQATPVNNVTTEQLNGAEVRKYTLTLPADFLFKNPESLGLDGLGIFSTTGILKGILNKSSQTGTVEYTFWLSTNGEQPVQRQTILKIGDNNERLEYEAVYQYYDIGQSGLEVTTPAGFPQP